MAKDKQFELLYKKEGQIRMLIRKNKRKSRLFDSYKYTWDEYSCPKCGLNSLHSSGNGNYGIICRKCGKDYETPDT